MRTFLDTQGVVWDVWEVRRDHVAGYGLPHSVWPELEDGWLCFASRYEKRRLASFPDDWRSLYVDQLASLCERAERVTSERARHDFAAALIPPASGLADHPEA